MIISVMKKEDYKHEKLLKSVGRPATMVKVRIVDDDKNEVPTGEIGEVAIAGDQ